MKSSTSELGLTITRFKPVFHQAIYFLFLGVDIVRVRRHPESSYFFLCSYELIPLVENRVYDKHFCHGSMR